MSAIPTAIDALLAELTAGMPDVQVVDGPAPVDVRGDVIAVGIGLDQDFPLDMDSSETPAGLQVVRKACTVECRARSWSGNAPVKPQRDRTYGLIAQVRTLLRANPTLGRQVVQARYAGDTYRPWRSEQAQLVVDVAFRVEVVVLTNA